MMTVEERVKRGVRLLDKKIPDWRSQLEATKLDMSSCYNCVLGQLYGEYLRGLEVLNIERNYFAENLGFDIFNYPTNTCKNDYNELQQTWEKELTNASS